MHSYNILPDQFLSDPQSAMSLGSLPRRERTGSLAFLVQEGILGPTARNLIVGGKILEIEVYNGFISALKVVPSTLETGKPDETAREPHVNMIITCIVFRQHF